MKKSEAEAGKGGRWGRANEGSPPKKQFELLYRERDPEQPYENIIFMKSKKCEAGSKRKSGQPPAQELKDMVAQLERQLKEKPRSKGQPQKPASSSAKNLFKNKQIKETFHSKASSRWNKYKKQELLAPDNVRKYKNMLSPSRAPKHREEAKHKEDTLSSKFLRSTQETFRKEKPRPAKQRESQQLPPFSSEPEEYILLENNFVELTHEDVNLLHLKITSNKTMPELKPFQRPQPPSSVHRCSVEQSPSIGEPSVAEEWEQSEGQGGEEVFEEAVMERFVASKVKVIQRWWRRVLQSREKRLDPIVFRRCNEEFEESMLFLHSNEVSPIKMIDTLNERRQDQVEERPDPLQLREEAAEQQLQTHLQMLQQLLEERRISAETFFSKKALIEAKYQHELQQVQELEKLMSENTQRAYQMTVKTQQDRTKLQTLTDFDQHTLDQIFGKDFSTPAPAPAPVLPPNYEMMIVNREKSTGCHFDNEEKSKPSIYQKHSEEDYSEDFEEEGEEGEGEGESGSLEEYNANFSQLLDEYKSRQEVKMEIDRRAAIQMGALVEEVPEEVRAERIGIDTSLSSIHRFILSFFKFYIFYYKDEFLRLINMPYGYSLPSRLAALHGYDPDDAPEEDENGLIYGLETVISDEILDEFYEKIYDLGAPMAAAQRANFEFERVHSRALLDCFNEALNHFRPYFLINGPPYPWNHSEKALTFYFIAEENIQEVFEKTQFKLLRWASSLCGLLPAAHTAPCPAAAALPADQALELYRAATHPDLAETRDDRLTKNERAEVAEGNHEWGNFEEQATVLRLETADFVFTRLVDELVREFWGQPHPHQLASFDFFYGLSEEESDDEHA